jgi:dipeptidyl aminopeptidase/acylaminoacyl peptidase
VVEGVPAIPPELKSSVSRYLEFRSASFQSWHPTRREMLIGTRFADSAQVFLVRQPLGQRKQLTFQSEPVAGAAFQPKIGECFVFSQDAGGGEFYQLYRYDLSDGSITLLTDGKSRNTGASWSKDGRSLAFTSTRRNGRDNDVHVMDPRDPKSDRRVLEVTGGGWGVLDWSENGQQLLLGEYISINESYLHLLDLPSGRVQLLTPKTGEKVAYGHAEFSKDGKSIFLTTDKDSEFKRLGSMEITTGKLTPLTTKIPWDIETFELSRDGKLIAFVANEAGSSTLHFLDAKSGKERRAPKLPAGVIGSIGWHDNNRDLAITFNSAKAPNDVYVVDARNLDVVRWTESEIGGLNTNAFIEPELVRFKSFDGLEVSAFVYRPDPKKFPGPRPALVIIHGGPEGQSQPIFQARNNYFLNELGIAVIYPNVRGSAGYGKTFLTLDNGSKREDSVRDIGALLDWIAKQPGLNADRVAVMGGSYGGYMVLASMIQHGARLRAGVDIVGISNFLTFLKNTQDYRRDLRRVEYGDEREPAMAEFLQRISPTANVGKLRKPLFVVQGKNDPRVPVTEAEQMVKAVRDQGGQVWYLMAKDEGHGFRKKPNADFQFLATILFLQEHLLK